MISHAYKCIFIHIPKSGGSSIESVIWRGERSESDLWMGFVSKYRNQYQTGGLQHLFARYIRNHVGVATFESYFKFSFVRNPWDKAVSQYSYMSKRPDLMEYIGMKPDCSFKKYLQLIQKKKHVQWDEQYKFVLDDNGELLVDFIGRFENIVNDTQFVFDKIGLTSEIIPHANKSDRADFDSYWENESIEMVASMYKKDINLFGYTFPSSIFSRGAIVHGK